MQDSKVYSSILQTQENFTKRLRRDKEINQKVANKQRLDKIMETLKDVAENSDDVQNNHTPMEICNMMLEKVDLEKAQSVLVLYNVELLFALRKAKYQGQVTFFTQSIDKKIWAQKLLPGVVVEYIDKEENPLYFMENQWPDKFDVVIANPPYSNNLHIKFLEKSIDLSENEVIFVHPSSSYIHSNKKYDKINEIVGKQIKNLRFFNGNPIFGIGLNVPCSITHLSKKDISEKFSFIDDINSQNIVLPKNFISEISHFGYNQTFNNIKVNISNFVKNKGSLQDLCFISSRGCKDHTLNNRDSYFVEFSRIRGHINQTDQNTKSIFKNDFFTMVPKDVQVKNNETPSYHIRAEFGTEHEAENFITYCKTNFVRMCLALGKTSHSLDCGPLRNIPIVDFTQEWTDEKLYAHFNITEEEQAFIKEVIPPYYD